MRRRCSRFEHSGKFELNLLHVHAALVAQLVEHWQLKADGRGLKFLEATKIMFAAGLWNSLTDCASVNC